MSQDTTGKVAALIRAVSNEKSTCFILPYQEDTVESLMSIINEKSKIIENHIKSIEPDDSAASIKRKICQAQDLETLRMKFLVRSYYQTRFNKIQHLILNGIKPNVANLSTTESQFATDLMQAMQKNQGPADIEFTDELDANLDKGFVAFKADSEMLPQNLSSVSSREAVDIVPNQIYIAKFEQVEHLYREDKIMFV